MFSAPKPKQGEEDQPLPPKIDVLAQVLHTPHNCPPSPLLTSHSPANDAIPTRRRRNTWSSKWSAMLKSSPRVTSPRPPSFLHLVSRRRRQASTAGRQSYPSTPTSGEHHLAAHTPSRFGNVLRRRLFLRLSLGRRVPTRVFQLGCNVRGAAAAGAARGRL